jgi:hypothetical protein
MLTYLLQKFMLHGITLLEIYMIAFIDTFQGIICPGFDYLL